VQFVSQVPLSHIYNIKQVQTQPALLPLTVPQTADDMYLDRQLKVKVKVKVKVKSQGKVHLIIRHEGTK
jgi:hypothetical protein